MYDVRWTERADNELAQLWMLANSQMRAAINAAANEIKRQLKSDPLVVGESRGEGERIAFEYPLGISFHVESERFVIVGHVWSIVRRGS
jgi:hypothetical protein